jgi:hypothetical protein
MTEEKPPVTPHEPPWWDGIAFRPAEHHMITAATGAAAARTAFRDKTVPPWRNPTREMIDTARATTEYVGPSSPTSLIVYITIGNSDDKLQQHDWANLIRELKATLTDFSGRTHIEAYSAPDATWQNMCICKEVERTDLDRLRAALRALRTTYHQDSVALVTAGRTELV